MKWCFKYLNSRDSASEDISTKNQLHNLPKFLSLYWISLYRNICSHFSRRAMSSSPTSKLKNGHVLVTTTELQDGDHLFPRDASRSMISREITRFQELLSLKTPESENLDVGDDQYPSEESVVRKEDNETSRHTLPTIKKILSQSLNPTSSMFNTEPFTPSSNGPCFANSSQSFWHHATALLLSRLLSIAKYPPHIQDQYIFFFNHSILPALGPVPSPANKWSPRLTRNNSPFEPSLQFRDDKQHVSYTIEPIGPQAGTPEDQLNQALPLASVSSLGTTKICPGLNLEWWNYFTNAFFVSASEIAAAPSLFTDMKPSPTCFLNFDLPIDDFAPVLKAYLFPHRRARLHGMSNGDLIFEAIRNLPTSTVGILPALEKVKSILSSREDPRIEPEELQDSEQATGQDPETTGMSVEMLSFDCIDPSKARIRIYTKTHNTSFANVQDIYTLGGQLNSIEVTARLKALKEFWTSLLILPDDWDEYEDQSAETLYFGFEIIPGRKDPDVEVFVPSWSCGVDRMGLTRGLSRYFKERGWDVGGKYKGDIQEVL